MESSHHQAGVLPVKVDWQEALLTLEAEVDLEQSGLDHLELLAAILDLFLHILGLLVIKPMVVRRRRQVVQFDLQEELGLEVAWLHVDLGSEADDVSQDHQFFGVADEEGFGVEAVGLAVDVGFD